VDARGSVGERARVGPRFGTDTVGGVVGIHAAEIDPLDAVARPWWESLEAAHGPLALFDAHTHIGRNDPDGYRQEPAELLAALAAVDARAAVFAMQEPDGYREANDFVIAAAADSAGVLIPYCRINPHDAAVAEAERALDAGARGSSSIRAPRPSPSTCRRCATWSRSLTSVVCPS
jgi:hypothetical protein